MKQSPGAGAQRASAPATTPATGRSTAWFADRARNAARHPVRIGAVAATIFVASLLALVIIPRREQRAAEAIPSVAERVDTMPLRAREAELRAHLSDERHALDSLRLVLAAADSADSVAASSPRQHSTLAALARQRRAQRRGDDLSDTVRIRERLDARQGELGESARDLALARATNARVAATVAAARDRASIDAPPLAMLGAALALGLALGGAISLGVELRDPRVASAQDAASATGLPVVGRLDVDWASVERVAHRATFGGVGRPPLAIYSDTPRLAAGVGTAVARATAAEGRSVLLVDTDTATGAAAALLQRPPTPGTSDVIARGAAWSGVLDAHVGSHSLPLDLVAAGTPIHRAPDTSTVEAAGRSLRELAARYDQALICVSSVDRPIVEVVLAAAEVTEVLACAVIGETSLAALRRDRDRWRTAGTPLSGLVLVHPDAKESLQSGGRRRLPGRWRSAFPRRQSHVG